MTNPISAPQTEPRAACGRAVALHAAGWLRLAAAPTFAIMAVLTGVSGGEMVCSAAQDMSALNALVSGMTPMYVLMSVFHATPWLMLVFADRS